MTRLLIVCFLLVVSHAATAQSELDAQGYRQDLALVRTALEQMHPSLYRFTSKATFDHVFDSLAAAISEQTSPVGFFRMLSKVEHHIRESHSHVRLSDALAQQIARQRVFPFEVLLQNQRLYIRTSLSEAGRFLEGAEVLSINGRPSQELLQHLARSTGLKSGYSLAAFESILSQYQNFALALRLFADEREQFVLSYRLPQTEEQSQVTVKGRLPGGKVVFPQHSPEPDPPISWSIEPEQDMAYLKITTFAHWVVSYKPKAYRKAFDAFFTALSKQEVGHLIIDVRNNRGGSELIAANLLQYLAPEPFRLYDWIKLKRIDFTNVIDVPGIQDWTFPEREFNKTDSGYYKRDDEYLKTYHPIRRHRFEGQVYALANGGSRSATNTFLALFKSQKIGKIVGQESGGVYQAVDGHYPMDVTLPYSGLKLHFPLRGFRLQTQGGDRLRGVPADYALSPSPQAVFEGEDPVLELAKELVRHEGSLPGNTSGQ